MAATSTLTQPTPGSHSTKDHSTSSQERVGGEYLEVRILRQDGPGEPSYWERHQIPREADMNVISVLQRVAAQAQAADGRTVPPVVWDCNCLEEVCGACTMVINGQVRQACSALVDKLLTDNPGEIELRPMSKFPVIRDLMVDRGRLFHGLKRVQAWVPVDGYYDAGAPAKISPASQETAYPLSECMSCGCCLEACPQYGKIEVSPRAGETTAEYEHRKAAAYDQGFVGPHAISQAVLFNSHPTGKMIEGDRWDSLMAEGGLQICGLAQNCVAVCPKSIPLTESIAKAGRALTVHAIKRIFDR
ncbi:MAG: succinate dehydrogenase iron-sulfur subunit [Pirellulales bacterium]|nr:succinate dehydrogenase iron-sulfur subunit [Pirellulales bacterium]